SNAGISWQIDLFGKLLKARDVNKWSAAASAENRQKVALAITTQVAELYWQLGSLNKKIALAEQNLSATEKLTDIVRSKYKHGAASEMDVLSAERSLRQQQSSMAALRHQHNQTHNALAVLVGEMPESDFAEPKDLPQPFRLPELAVNVPSEVLDNRPDIRAARDRLMADMATVDLRVRDFFPTFGLNLGVSAGGSQLSNIVADPVGSAALNVALPFLNFPDNVLNLKVSQVKYQSDLAAYKNTLYTALSEVENSLSQYNQLNQQHKLLKQNLETTRRLEKMRQVRYNNGADDLQKLLDAQSDTRQAEQAVVENELALYQNFLTRYVALGGKNILPDKI
ncbi:MAG: TolC family protein, partial [Neisseriaceae bacterium]|nr:TolC family protein [Neisseriaceae bacterium]